VPKGRQQIDRTWKDGKKEGRKEGRKGFCGRNLFSYKIANKTGRLKTKKTKNPSCCSRHETMSEVSQLEEGLKFGGRGRGGGGGGGGGR
jgi:hypothetical protein